MEYQVVLAIHIVSVIMLLGFGGGSAFYKLVADMSKKPEVIAHTNKTVVLVDWIVTTPAVLLQPITGVYLVSILNIPYTTPWLIYSILLYLFSIVLWLYALYLQIKMKQLSDSAISQGKDLDDSYYKYFKIWIVLGVFSFFAMAVIYGFMIFKPTFV